MKLTIIRGIQGSGKTTKAREIVRQSPNTVRVNRDDIRILLHGGYVDKIHELEVNWARDVMIRNALKSGRNVVSDDAGNLMSNTIKHLFKIADHFGAEVEVIDIDTPLEECIARDALRPGKANVGEAVIRDWHERYLKNGFPKLPSKPEAIDMIDYDPNVDLPSCVVFDIDGTLAKMVERSPYDYSRVLEDDWHPHVFEMLQAFVALRVPIIFLSGRPDSCREDTIKWLEQYLVLYFPYELHMRSTGDNRADFIVKYELFDKHIRNHFRIKAWFDDRNQVVDTMRSIGIPVYQVADGDF